MSTPLQDRIVVVMGAGSSAPGWSNGKAAAVAYARAGARVVCADFIAKRAQEVAALIVDEGGHALELTCDATDGSSVKEAVDQVVAKYGRIDVLHNNVGFGGAVGAPDQVDEAAFDREIATSLKSAYLGIRYVAPHMRRRNSGVITNISSLASIRFMRLPTVAYSVAKAGLEALTRASAAAYGRDNIRVNCLRLGILETPIIELGMKARGFDQARADIEMTKSREKVPLRGEHGDAWDAAAAAVFLASDAAKYISGTILNIDGALECAPQ
jgi:NAD(P)-dependent dehydrogenase (short-subunit alcohol dehydrogenase family)